YYNMDQVVGQALATFRRIDQAEQAGADEAETEAGAERVPAE
ncbi:UDP-galactopyranose mutase, partial [Faunimonas pinastri]